MRERGSAADGTGRGGPSRKLPGPRAQMGTALRGSLGGDAERAEDLDPVLGRGRHHCLYGGWLDGGRWEAEGLGGLGEHANEVFQARGLDDEEEARFVRADGKGMRNVAGAVDKR